MPRSPRDAFIKRCSPSVTVCLSVRPSVGPLYIRCFTSRSESGKSSKLVKKIHTCTVGLTVVVSQKVKGQGHAFT